MKNIVYIVAINWDLQGPAIKSWEYWCKKNNCDFYVIDESITWLNSKSLNKFSNKSVLSLKIDKSYDNLS